MMPSKLDKSCCSHWCLMDMSIWWYSGPWHPVDQTKHITRRSLILTSEISGLEYKTVVYVSRPWHGQRWKEALRWLQIGMQSSQAMISSRQPLWGMSGYTNVQKQRLICCLTYSDQEHPESSKWTLKSPVMWWLLFWPVFPGQRWIPGLTSRSKQIAVMVSRLQDVEHKLRMTL